MKRQMQRFERNIDGRDFAVVVGHTPLRRPAVLGNVYHIDTGGWLPDGSGYFTLLDLSTLETIPPMPANLNWEEA